MAFALDDRVKETSTTTGTGTYSLDGAVTGFQTFVAGIGNGNTCYYCATDGTNWEVGIGTVTDATPDTLARTTILSSSNADAAVNWAAGTRQIACTFPAYAGLNKGLARAPQVYTASSNTWSKPVGLSYIIVEAVGAGGGSAASNATTGGAPGGGAGGYARKTIAASSLAATETVLVGTGGAAGVTGATAAGGAGALSSFGTFLTACGGAGGPSGGASGGTPGGSGGIATSGDVNVQGGDGGYGTNFGNTSGVTAGMKSGDGGASFFGGGGTGVAKSWSSVSAPGIAGRAYGSGGGGGAGTTGAGAAGNAGKAGLVIVWEFI